MDTRGENDFQSMLFLCLHTNPELVIVLYWYFIAATGIARIVPCLRDICGAHQRPWLHWTPSFCTCGVFYCMSPRIFPAAVRHGPCIDMNVRGENLTAAGEKAGGSGWEDQDWRRSFKNLAVCLFTWKETTWSVLLSFCHLVAVVQLYSILACRCHGVHTRQSKYG